MLGIHLPVRRYANAYDNKYKYKISMFNIKVGSVEVPMYHQTSNLLAYLTNLN